MAKQSKLRGRARPVPHVAGYDPPPGLRIPPTMTERARMNLDGVDVRMLSATGDDATTASVLDYLNRACVALIATPVDVDALASLRADFVALGPARLAQVANLFVMSAAFVVDETVADRSAPTPSQVSISVLLGIAWNAARDLGYDLGCSLADVDLLSEKGDDR